MSIQDWIKNEVDTNDVVLFMKGTKAFRRNAASPPASRQILGYMQVAYKDVNVLEDDDDPQRDQVVFSDWPTIPQLYVKGEFVGGCDIIREMFQSQELQSHMTDKGISTRQSA
jgi:monothiol glutaredoxin